MSYGLWVMGYGLWVMGYRLWVMGYRLWVMGYGLWVMGYRLWVMGFFVPAGRRRSIFHSKFPFFFRIFAVDLWDDILYIWPITE